MKKLKFDVVGAYDRFNYGDMLFPFIIEYIIKTNFNDYDLNFYSMRNSDYSKYGAKITKTIANMNFDDHYVIIAGGDTMVANVQFMYLDNINSKIIFFIERCIRRLIGSYYVKWVMKRTGVNNEYPYDIESDKALYNGVGGCGLRDINDKEKIIKILKKALYLGVRDIATFNEVKNIGARLVPDSALILSDIWKKEILDQKYSDKYKELDCNYIVIQLSDKYGSKTIKLIMEVIINLFSNKKIRTVLLPLGRATSHGDTVSLKKLSKKTKDISYYFDNISLKEITWIIANSAGFMGTSLHGNIVALSYEKKSILLANEGSKNWWYWKTWLEGSNCILSSFDEVTININKLYGMKNENNISSQKAEIYNHFSNMIDCIKNDI